MSDKATNFYNKLYEEAQKRSNKVSKNVPIIQVGSATCEHAAGSKLIYEEFRKHIAASGQEVILKYVGCTGRCSREPIITVMMPGQQPIIYQKVDIEGAHEIFMSHILNKHPVTKYQLNLPQECKRQKSATQEKLSKWEVTKPFFQLYGDIDFYCSQSRLALRNAGLIEPLSIDDYVMHGGFLALKKVLEKNDPQWVVDEIKTSKLRGRGGAGFPTAKKWEVSIKQEEKTRYLICNADQGDPGAFMNRIMLESDPFSTIEGMMIAGFAIGAQRGFIYIRAEYPLAVERLEQALEICREKGILGKNVLGTDFSFELEIRLGAGAFVCGEATALIQSIEGSRGQPRIKPPYTAEKGLWGKPTVMNNVETFANVPLVILLGGKAFNEIGTEESGGTKVFALAGKVKHTGLVEVPMGTTLRTIVEEVGGGIPNNKKFKAIQTGGPAGGFIPADLTDTPVDYPTLAKLGSIMGSGGMIVLDEDNCMVDVAKFYLAFTQDESCGKCTPCREGTKRMLEILEKITQGKGTLEDIEHLERLSNLVSRASLCGLGMAAPNPVLSSLKYFREEYIAHVVEKRCPAKRCTALIRYEIDKKKCVGCTLCAKNCPMKCITSVRQQPHEIDQSHCVKCGKCFATCRFGAVQKI